MDEAEARTQPPTASQLRTLAAVVGVVLDDERAAALAPQAAQHFALLRAIDALDPGEAEPAAEFRLDRPTGENGG